MPGAGWRGEGSVGVQGGRLAGQVTGHRSQVAGPRRPDPGAVGFIVRFCPDAVTYG